MTPAQRVLVALAPGPLYLVPLARATGLDADTTRRAVRSLVRGGLVVPAPGGAWRAVPPPRCAVCGDELPVTEYARPGRRGRYCSPPCRTLARAVSEVVARLRADHDPHLVRATRYVITRLEDV